MDSLGSLALATDEPEENLIDKKPEAKSANIITLVNFSHNYFILLIKIQKMWKHIIFQVIYQLIIMNIFIYYGKKSNNY